MVIIPNWVVLSGIRELIQKGMRPMLNQEDRSGLPPIVAAIKSRSLELVRMLIRDYSVDVRYVNPQGKDLFHIAAFCSNTSRK